MRIDFLVHGKLIGTADTEADGFAYQAHYAELDAKMKRASNVDVVTMGGSYVSWARVSEAHYRVEVVDPSTITIHKREN